SGAAGGSFAAANYAISYLTGILTVAAAPLTVTAADVAKSYGQTPALSGFTPVGLQNGESIGSVAETSPGAAATASVGGGPYTITANGAAGGCFAAANYAIRDLSGGPIAEMLGLVPMAPSALNQASTLVAIPGTTQTTTESAEAPSNSDTTPDHPRQQD
ncbi:MAG: MBG domain-containing protein, partial [Rhodospirillaceae bacterium]